MSVYLPCGIKPPCMPCQGECDLRELEVTENGEYSPVGFDGYSNVIVEVETQELPNASGNNF